MNELGPYKTNHFRKEIRKEEKNSLKQTLLRAHNTSAKRMTQVEERHGYLHVAYVRKLQQVGLVSR